MVYLPGELRQTRSRNASNLYQDQAAMGVVPPTAPQGASAPDRPAAPPQIGGGIAPSAEGGFTPGGQAQPSRLTEYIQTQQNQRQMLAARGMDLQLAQMMAKALDPSLPKGFRQLGLKQISQTLGIDPRGDRAKEIINTISGLDPQSLEGLRRGIVGAADETQPGELTQMTRGILTGQVPPDQLLSMARTATAPPSAPGPSVGEGGPGVGEGGEGEARPMMLGAPPPPSGSGPDEGLVQLAQAPGVPGQGPSPPPGPGPVTPQETYPPLRRLFQPTAPAAEPLAPRESQTAPGNREVIPELTTALGLDPTQRYKVRDLQAAGYNIPSDETHMRTVSNDIRTSRTSLVNSFTLMSQLAGLIRGRPEVLDYPISGVHVPTQVTQLADYIRGVGNLFGFQVDAGTLRRAATDKIEGAEGQITNIADNVGNWVTNTGIRAYDAAEVNARVKAIVVPLAFAMAAAEGQTGRHLSDRDVQLQLQRLGQSNSPTKFISALMQTAEVLYNQHNTSMRSQLGQELPLAAAISPEIANIWRAGGVIEPPPGVGGDTSIRPRPRPVMGVTEAGPPPAVTGGGWNLNVGGESVAMPSGQNIPPAAPTPSEPPPIQTARPTGRIARSSPTLEETEEAGRARLREEREYLHEVRGQNRRRLEIAESVEARAQRAEVEARRERIQRAFAQIGAALRGGSSGGGGLISSPGGEQDAAAFRINPAPQRRPPTPVPAGPFQPQVPQQSSRRRR